MWYKFYTFFKHMKSEVGLGIKCMFLLLPVQYPCLVVVMVFIPGMFVHCDCRGLVW